MPDAAWEKMAKASQDQQMQNTAEEKNMPEAFQHKDKFPKDAHVEKPPGLVVGEAASPEGDVARSEEQEETSRQGGGEGHF